MSIWSSIQGPDVRAIDMHAEGSDEYACTGEANVDLGVATARSWNAAVRLDADGPDVHLCLALTRDAARELARQLVEAAKEDPDGG